MANIIAFVMIVMSILSVNANAAPRIEIPSSFNPVGSGARALGFGGSFIAMADDATAASWNPGALIQLRRPELALVYSYFERTEDNRFTTNPEANGKQSVSKGDLNYLALSYPCPAKYCGKNMIFSVNYQRLYEFNRHWDISFSRAEGNGGLGVDEDIRYNQQGALYALGFAYAIQASNNLSLGVTLNFWQDVLKNNSWYQTYFYNRQGEFKQVPFREKITIESGNDFDGFNFNVGLLWDIYQQNEQKFTFGLVYKSGFDAKLTRDVSFFSTKTLYYSEPFPDIPDKTIVNELPPERSNLTQSMPKSLGAGLAFQWSDAVTTSLDVYMTDWSRFVLTDEQGLQFSPISGIPFDEVKIKDTTQVRFGLEYRIISQKKFGNNYIIPIRAGAFKDPAAAQEQSDNIYGLSIGSGIAFHTFVFDIAYQKRWSGKIGMSGLQGLGFSQRIDEHTLYASMFVRF